MNEKYKEMSEKYTEALAYITLLLLPPYLICFGFDISNKKYIGIIGIELMLLIVIKYIFFVIKYIFFILSRIKGEK